MKLTTADHRHQHDEADAAERAVRRDHRRKERGLGRDRCRALLSLMSVSLYGSMARKTTASAARAAEASRGRTKRPRKPQMDAGRDRGSVPPLSRRQPEPKGELQHINPYTLLVAVVLSAQATDAGVNKATPALFAVADTPEKMAALGEDEGARLHQDHRALSHQGEERDRAVAEADRRARRQGAARRAKRSRRCPASGARPRTSCSTSPSASRRSRSTPISSASATAPGWRPARRRSRSSWSSSRRAGEIQAARAPLADPARPLHLHGAQAAVREVHHRRPVPLAGEDGGLELRRLTG